MENEGYETIDLLEVLNAVRQHLLAVILTTVILAAAGFGVSKFLITPQYEASALMIVNTRQDTTSNVTSDQINSATKLVSTYSIIIKSDTVLQQVIDNLGLSLTYEKLAERVTVSAVDDTQVMKITVRSDNPEWARQVCEQITVVSPDVILESVEAGSVKVISSAAVNPTPVSPNVGRNTMLGGVLGLVISVGIILLAVLLDNKIHTEDDIAKYLDLAVVGVIPENQGVKRMSKASKNTSRRKLFTVGSDAPFQFVEAYKSLRTNLEFLSSAGNCKTILITSSVPEEGKTNVAVNLAMTIAASGKRVVLVDCDLRKATISRYLRIPRNHAGLTNVITSKDEGALAAALVRVKDFGITVLTAGTIPPNPTELLSAPMAEKIFTSLQKAFDYVIVDTPPVSLVTDAAVLCRMADGVLLVVRPGVTTIQSAQLSKKNLEAVNAHILGVVMNGYNGKQSGRRDGYSYAYSYSYYNDNKQGNDA